MLSLVPILVDDRFFFIDISYVKEILPKKEFFVVPKVPDFTVGIVNVRGEIIPVFNLRTILFGRKGDDFKDGVISYLVLINVSGKRMGLAVDKVSKVVYVSEDNIKEYTESIWKDIRFLKFFVEVKELNVLGGVIDVEGILKYIGKSNNLFYRRGGKL